MMPVLLRPAPWDHSGCPCIATLARERYAPGLLFVLRQAQASSDSGAGSGDAPVACAVALAGVTVAAATGSASRVDSTGSAAEAAATLLARTAALMVEEAVAEAGKRRGPLLDSVVE